MKRFIRGSKDSTLQSTSKSAETYSHIINTIKRQMPKTAFATFNYDVDMMSDSAYGVYLYAKAKRHYNYDDDVNYNEMCIDAMEDWAKSIANQFDTAKDDVLKELRTNLLSTCDYDWYSGMSLFNDGTTPMTYEGFTLSAENE